MFIEKKRENQINEKEGGGKVTLDRKLNIMRTLGASRKSICVALLHVVVFFHTRPPYTNLERLPSLLTRRQAFSSSVCKAVCKAAVTLNKVKSTKRSTDMLLLVFAKLKKNKNPKVVDATCLFKA